MKIDRWGFPTTNTTTTAPAPVAGPAAKPQRRYRFCSEAQRRIDEGLRSLCARAEARPYELGEIAEACGTTRHSIALVERRALRKMRLALALRGISPQLFS